MKRLRPAKVRRSDAYEQVMGMKAIATTDERSCALVQKTVLGSLSRAKATIQRVEIAGVVSWRIG